MVSFVFWSKSFRPIVTAAVKTHVSGTEAITFNLVVMNSGAIPAKHIKLSASVADLERSLGTEVDAGHKSRWLKCFDAETEIYLLQNNDKVSCSFGTSKTDDSGFWKYNSIIPITIQYQGWLGKHYTQKQELHIQDSDSFTGFMWSDV
ncbi:hypothetical protein D3C76_1433200 [compost metagenome]